MQFSVDIAELQNAPGAYQSLQAVRLIERHLWNGPKLTEQNGRVSSLDGLVHHPGLLFRSPASLAFPTGEIESITPVLDEANSAASQWLVEVAFFGLTGPQGVLPLHVCGLLLGDGNTARPALKELLDLFDNRMISLFMRTWEHSRHLLCLERARRSPGPATDDAFSSSFRALASAEPQKPRRQAAISPNLPLFFAGLFASSVRPASGLQQVLSHTLDLPIHVQEFVGEWIDIPLDKQSKLTSESGKSTPLEMVCLGRATWSVQDRYRIELGPVDYETFLRLIPGGDLFAAVIEIGKLYAGCQFMIEIQPLLAAEEVPPCKLDSDAGFQLGMNTWLTSEPLTEPVRDATFTHRGADKTPEIVASQ